VRRVFACYISAWLKTPNNTTPVAKVELVIIKNVPNL
jgi:hypothetical protein